MLRRTKIVTTLGPATDDPAVLEAMIRAGADVGARQFLARSRRGSRAPHRAGARSRGPASAATSASSATWQGPKIRIERFAKGPVLLVEGAPFTLDVSLDPDAGSETAVGVAYKELPRDVHAGDVLLLNDGQIVLDVEKVEGPRIHTRVKIGGELSNAKGINRQGGGLSAGALTDKDREDIGIACAPGRRLHRGVLRARRGRHPRSARCWRQGRRRGAHRRQDRAQRGDPEPQLAIIDATDVVMVARGDLGVEMGYAELTGLQKTIIHQSRNRNRVVITATQMMESMVSNPIPTRAEVSDVSNAVMDGTDAVMLSGESAVGSYPVKAVEAMAEIIRGAEKYQLSHSRVRHRVEGQFQGTDEAIAMAVMYTANHLKTRAIVALTESGSTPLWMSRIRSDIPIYAFTRHEVTRRRVTLYRGVYPVPFDITHTDPQTLYKSIFHLMIELGLAAENDLVILTKGEMSGVSGGTNSMKILRVTRD